jgi:hypothetical protein
VADTEPTAMRQLGFMNDRGIGVAKDYAEARKWYEKAVPLGDSIAMNNLGYLYEAGNGVKKDPVRPRELCVQAAALGLPLAMVNLGNLYGYGRGVPRDYAQAHQWYEKAAAGGQTGAMIPIGELYRQGLGVKDRAQARAWFEKAAGAGDASAAKAFWGSGTTLTRTKLRQEAEKKFRVRRRYLVRRLIDPWIEGNGNFHGSTVPSQHSAVVLSARTIAPLECHGRDATRALPHSLGGSDCRFSIGACDYLVRHVDTVIPARDARCEVKLLGHVGSPRKGMAGWRPGRTCTI